jgi:hypothetical protein
MAAPLSSAATAPTTTFNLTCMDQLRFLRKREQTDDR